MAAECLIVKMTSFSNPNCQCSTSVKPPRDLTPGHLGKPGGLWTSGWQVKILKPPASRGILSACTCLHNADKRLVQLFKCISADVWKLSPVSYLMPLLERWAYCGLGCLCLMYLNIHSLWGRFRWCFLRAVSVCLSGRKPCVTRAERAKSTLSNFSAWWFYVTITAHPVFNCKAWWWFSSWL